MNIWNDKIFNQSIIKNLIWAYLNLSKHSLVNPDAGSNLSN